MIVNKAGTVHTVGKIKYIKTSITQVKKAIIENGEWHGILIGNKVSLYHAELGWHLGNRCSFHSIERLEEMIRLMIQYLPKELGNRIAFYNVKEG